MFLFKAHLILIGQSDSFNRLDLICTQFLIKKNYKKISVCHQLIDVFSLLFKIAKNTFFLNIEDFFFLNCFLMEPNFLNLPLL